MKIPFIEDRTELLRWALSGVAVVALHGAVAAMVTWSDDELAEPTAAMVIDLSPFPTAPPESLTELPPGPEQVEAEAAPQIPVTETKEQLEEPVETQQQSRVVQTELAQVVNPEVALDTAPPKPEQEIKTPQENQLQAPETTAPPQMPQFDLASVAAAQVQGAPNPERSNANPKYYSSISAQIERNKRYPADGKNDRGIAQVAFSIDRRGRVLSSRIVTSSGSAALDREALQIITRAQPFPPPPASVAGAEIPFTVPLRFHMK